MSKPIRIGTRASQLAMWQAETVAEQLNQLGVSTEIVPVTSDGDVELTKPLYEMGITGIFTKTLDIAMLTGKVDIAVHSMKDVPTQLPQNIVQAAVLKRATTRDLLVYKKDLNFLETTATIGTGSLRRKAQWLNRYPNHQVENLRGNVNSRLEKLEKSDWNGAIFATAGLERIGIKPEQTLSLDWMIPAPAQGAMMVVAMHDDGYALDALAQLNDIETEVCTAIERQFLKTLEGGCTAPIGALATYSEHDDTLHFEGVLLSEDGKQKVEIVKDVPIEQWKKLGYYAAKELLENGGAAIMQQFKNQKKE